MSAKLMAISENSNSKVDYFQNNFENNFNNIRNNIKATHRSDDTFNSEELARLLLTPFQTPHLDIEEANVEHYTAQNLLNSVYDLLVKKQKYAQSNASARPHIEKELEVLIPFYEKYNWLWDTYDFYNKKSQRQEREIEVLKAGNDVRNYCALLEDNEQKTKAHNELVFKFIEVLSELKQTKELRRERDFWIEKAAQLELRNAELENQLSICKKQKA